MKGGLEESDSQKKVLVVTEYLYTGEGLDDLVAGFQKVEWPCDVATIGLSMTTSQKTLESRWGSRLVSGGLKYVPQVYVLDISGVQKPAEEGLFAVPNKAPSEKIRAHRLYAQKVTQQIVDQYLTRTNI